MSQQNKNIDEDLSNNEKEQGPVDAKNHNSSDAAAEYDATFQPTEDKVSNCEERLEKSVATATKKSEEAVNQVEKELKKEKAFNNFNGWLSIVTFGLLILVVLGDYIYESSSNARNKTRLSDIRSNVIRLEDRVQSLYDADNVTSITLQNTVNHARMWRINSMNWKSSLPEQKLFSMRLKSKKKQIRKVRRK